MKKVIIHIHTLYGGGAEKSLISFLNSIPENKYDIDLLLISKTGLFLPLVPSWINIIDATFPYKCLAVSPHNIRYYLKHGIKYWFKKIFVMHKYKQETGLSFSQYLWKNWSSSIPVFQKQYDVAISYNDGITNYYVIDKVKAQKKILWVHNEYDKLGYNRAYDETCFSKADAIVTISELCRNNLVKNFPNLENKFHILENISNPNLINKLALENISDPQFSNSSEDIKILSIGRLAPQKNYSLAVKAAKILRDKGVKFKWFVIGEGVLRGEIESEIKQLDLCSNFILLGQRTNPYYYIKSSDIIVQSSLFEGKSIAIDEAKILHKPIVSTNYNTVFDLLTDGVNGIITEMTPQGLASGIEELINNPDKQTELISNLEKENLNNLDEVNKYFNLIEN